MLGLFMVIMLHTAMVTSHKFNFDTKDQSHLAIFRKKTNMHHLLTRNVNFDTNVLGNMRKDFHLNHFLVKNALIK